MANAHPVGRHKLRYFESVGFSPDRPEELIEAIRFVAAHGTVSRRLVSAHGTRYIVDGAVASPAKTIVVLRTVWIARPSESVPHFVTAYPRRP
jgi:hypothetical protein